MRNEGYRSFNKPAMANIHENNRAEVTTEIVAPANVMWSTSKADQNVKLLALLGERVLTRLDRT
jgi:hypothetical protein